jgi:hypothetical protein
LTSLFKKTKKRKLKTKKICHPTISKIYDKILLKTSLTTTNQSHIKPKTKIIHSKNKNKIIHINTSIIKIEMIKYGKIKTIINNKNSIMISF